MTKTDPANPTDATLPGCVRTATLQYLRSLEAAGVTEVASPDGSYSFEFADSGSPAVEPSPVTAPKPASTQDPALAQKFDSGSSRAQSATQRAVTKPIRPAAAVQASTDPYPESLEIAARTTALNVLADEVGGCTRCAALCANRTKTVFGVGTPTPSLVFYGEGPGAEEDRTGEPFVGAAGQLLTKIIGAMQLSREEVYIMNTVKCRPPENRNPTEDELANCREFADKQFDILQPEFICCLGSVAAKSLLQTKQSIGRMRGKLFGYRSSKVLVTYHPAYLLRTPSAKAHVWNDMKFLLKEMGPV